MTRPLLAALLALALPVAAQQTPAAAVAAVLRETAPRPAPEALAGLRRRAAGGDAAAKELEASLPDAEKAAALRARLASVDADGSLAAELRRLVSAADAQARERRVAAATASALRAVEPPEEDGATTAAVSVFGGAVSAGGGSAPLLGGSFGLARARGPWTFELEGDLQASAGGRRAWGLEGGVERGLGSSPYSLFVEGEHSRDDHLGIRGHESVKAGLGATLLRTGRHSLEASAGYGLAKERHATGETETHPAVLVAAEYAWRAAGPLSLTQFVEYEFDPRARADNELKSVTALVYDLSRRAALRLAYEYRRRGEPVEGYPGSRDQVTLGVVFGF